MCSFRDPNLVNFYFYELTHFLDWMRNTLWLFHRQYKHSDTFANHKYEELFYPQNSENLRPHDNQSSRENGTQSSGTSPLASNTKAPPPLPLGLKTVTQQMQKESCHVRTSLKGWTWLQQSVSYENEEINLKNNSQLYNSNFIWSEIKFYSWIPRTQKTDNQNRGAG